MLLGKNNPDFFTLASTGIMHELMQLSKNHYIQIQGKINLFTDTKFLNSVSIATSALIGNDYNRLVVIASKYSK